MSAGRVALRADAKAWRAEALKLRVAGQSMREIAVTLNKSVGAVHKGITEELKNIPAEGVDELRRVEGDRHDAEYTRLGRIIETILVPKKKGDIVSISAVEAAIKAVAARTNISVQRAKLFGLNAKESLDITGELALTHGAEDDLIDRLTRLVAGGAESDVPQEPEPSGEAGPPA